MFMVNAAIVSVLEFLHIAPKGMSQVGQPGGAVSPCGALVPPFNPNPQVVVSGCWFGGVGVAERGLAAVHSCSCSWEACCASASEKDSHAGQVLGELLEGSKAVELLKRGALCGGSHRLEELTGQVHKSLNSEA